jgi:hypothetical protein
MNTRVQFLADRSLDDVEVSKQDQSTFKKAMNSNMQSNRVKTKPIVENMFNSSKYPAELWPLIKKQDVWYNYIGDFHTKWLLENPVSAEMVSLLETTTSLTVVSAENSF